MVTRLDRLARSIADLCKILAQLEAKGASLRVLNMNLDTATPTGKLILNVLGSIAQFERELMLERQREGIAEAKWTNRDREAIGDQQSKRLSGSVRLMGPHPDPPWVGKIWGGGATLISVLAIQAYT
jgi:DNA invertase Pin-like site-specific DNA recombinase